MDNFDRLNRLHLDLTWLMQSFDITLEQRDYIDEVCWIVHQAKSILSVIATENAKYSLRSE